MIRWYIKGGLVADIITNSGANADADAGVAVVFVFAVVVVLQVPLLWVWGTFLNSGSQRLLGGLTVTCSYSQAGRGLRLF